VQPSNTVKSFKLHICSEVYTTPGSIPLPAPGYSEYQSITSCPLHYQVSFVVPRGEVEAYALTIGTIMTTSKTQIPIPIMIRIRISFHLPISPTLGSAEKGHTTSAYEHGWHHVGILELIPRGYLPVSSDSETGWVDLPVLSCSASSLSPLSATFVMFWCIT
jgi:hypothetical protein